jgi:RNA polymerase sigma factor (sigma-70 family)
MAGASPTAAAIDAVWRIEAPRLIAALTRLVHDLAIAEDLAQDALVAALETWPASGVPDRPGAWLMATARHRAIDLFRRNDRLRDRHEQLARDLSLQLAMGRSDLDAATLDDVPDDLLGLLFMTCHPVLSREARVALTLRLLGGLTTSEIARAFLVPEPTVAQRIVRAKRTLTAARAAFEVPDPPERAQRLTSVLDVVYLIFNEGYAASAGDDWMRPALCEDALRLGRVLAGLVSREPEVQGLVALMEIQASRTPARTAADGSPVLLPDQDRTRWDRVLLARGLVALDRAQRLGVPAGPFRLQAEIAACHARAATAADTDWVRIAALYEALARRAPSPVVELNRAVALGMAFGPAVGLDHVDRLAAEPALARYHLLPSVRGDLLARLGRTDEARAELLRAAELTANAREQALLRARAAGLR